MTDERKVLLYRHYLYQYGFYPVFFAMKNFAIKGNQKEVDLIVQAYIDEGYKDREKYDGYLDDISLEGITKSIDRLLSFNMFDIDRISEFKHDSIKILLDLNTLSA